MHPIHPLRSLLSEHEGTEILSRPVLHRSYLLGGGGGGVRGSGHGLVVRPKGYVVWSHFLKGRKADQGFRQGV